MRRDFVANVSHELKTPLAGIKAYAETLREGAIHDQEHNIDFLRRIESQAERLEQLILDMLSLARVESGEQPFEMENIDVRTTVSDCLKRHAALAEAKHISLQVEPPESPLAVRADREGLRQILDNLLDNAIKYTPQAGRVTIRWRRDDELAVFEVEDTGIGIATSEQQRVFERFYRVDRARSRELGGTGLGLSIVKHLAQAFGGGVSLRSRPGHGSVFIVRLAVAQLQPSG